MLTQRLRRWTNIKTSLFQRVVFAGMIVNYCCRNHSSLQDIDEFVCTEQLRERTKQCKLREEKYNKHQYYNSKTGKSVVLPQCSECIFLA